MEELRKDKIHKAVEEVAEVFRKLELNMSEIEVITRSGNVSARVLMVMQGLDDETLEYLEKSQTKTMDKVVMILPAITSATAVLISIISIIVAVWK